MKKRLLFLDVEIPKRQRPEQYKNASRETLMDDARSEVVAEACETMLTDTDAAQRIGQSLKSKDATLFEKVVQWFRDLAAKLREAYKDLHPDSEIAKYAKEMAGYASECHLESSGSMY